MFFCETNRLIYARLIQIRYKFAVLEIVLTDLEIYYGCYAMSKVGALMQV